MRKVLVGTARPFLMLLALAAGAVALTLFHYGEWLDGAHSFSINLDNNYFLHPLHHYIASAFSLDSPPYRNILGNVAIYHQPNLGIFYPFYFFWTGIWATPEAAVINGQYVTVFHVGILGAGMGVFLYTLGVRGWAALLAAAIVISSSHVRMILPWLWLLSSYAWLPWVAAGIVLVLEGRHTFWGALLAAGAFALAVTAHPAHSIVHTIYFSGALVAGWLYHQRARERKQDFFKPAFHRLALFAGLAVLLCGPMLWMPILHGGEYIRWTSLGPVIGKLSIPFEASVLYPASLSDLLNVFMPTKEAYSAGNSFLGPLVVYLAAYGAWSRWKVWYVPPLVVIGLYALLLTTGKTLGLAYINYYLLPFMGMIRELPIHLMLFVLSAATLAAVGLGAMLAPAEEERSRIKRFDLIALPVLGGLFLLAWLQHGRVHADHFLAYTLAAFLVLKFGTYFRAPGYVLVPVLSILVILIAKTPYMQFCEQVPSETNKSLPQNWPYRSILAEAKDAAADMGDYRLQIDLLSPPVERRDPRDPKLLGSQAVYMGIPTFSYYLSPMPYANFIAYFNKEGNGRYTNYLKLFGGKYLLTDKGAPDDSFRPVRSWGKISLYATDEALPHHRLVNQSAGAYKDREDFESLVSASEDYKSKVYFPQQNLGQLGHWLSGNGDAGSVVQYARLDNNRERFDLEAKTPSMLVVNNHFDDAWRAYVDGEEVDPVEINLGQVGVPVEQGKHQVVLEYYPRDFIWLTRLQVIAALSILVFAVFRIATARRRQAAGS